MTASDGKSGAFYKEKVKVFSFKVRLDDGILPAKKRF